MEPLPFTVDDCIEADPGMQLLVHTLQQHAPDLQVTPSYSRGQLARLQIKKHDLLRLRWTRPGIWRNCQEVIHAAIEGGAIAFNKGRQSSVAATNLKLHSDHHMTLTLSAPGMKGAEEVIQEMHSNGIRRLRGQPMTPSGLLALHTSLPREITLESGGRFQAHSDGDGDSQFRRWHATPGPGLNEATLEELKELQDLACREEEGTVISRHELTSMIQVTVRTNMTILHELNGCTLSLNQLNTIIREFSVNATRDIKINPAEIEITATYEHSNLQKLRSGLNDWIEELRRMLSPEHQRAAMRILRAGPDLDPWTDMPQNYSRSDRPEDGWPLPSTMLNPYQSSQAGRTSILDVPARLRGEAGVRWALRQLGIKALHRPPAKECLTTGDLAAHELLCAPTLLGRYPAHNWQGDSGEHLRCVIRAGLTQSEYPWLAPQNLWRFIARFPGHAAQWLQPNQAQKPEPRHKLTRQDQIEALRGGLNAMETHNDPYPQLNSFSYRGWWSSVILRSLTLNPALYGIGSLMDEYQSEKIIIPGYPNSNEGLKLNMNNLAAIAWQLCWKQVQLRGRPDFSHAGFSLLNTYVHDYDLIRCCDIQQVYIQVMSQSLILSQTQDED